MKRPNRLLVVPLFLPGDIKREEIHRAINYQLFETFGDKITFLDFDEEFELYKYISGEPDFIKDCNWFCSGYKELKERHQEILECVDSVLIYGMPVRNGYADMYAKGLPKLFDLETIKIELDKCHRKDDYGFVNYGTRVKLRNMLARMVFLECLWEDEGINVFHYMVDPREVNFGSMIGKDRYHILGGLKSTVGPLKPIPFFEWGLNNTYIQELDKSRDFYFIGTMLYKERYGLKDITKKFNDGLGRRKPSSDGFYNKLNGYAGILNDPYARNVGRKKDDDTISQSKYYYKIMTSRYTYVNVPFMESEFNYQRFMESIILGCIPFVDKGNNLENLRLTYSEFYDIIIKNGLVIDTDVDSYKNIINRIKNYSENGDTELISKFKDTKAYKALTDKEKIKECWRKKLRWKDV